MEPKNKNAIIYAFSGHQFLPVRLISPYHYYHLLLYTSAITFLSLSLSRSHIHTHAHTIKFFLQDKTAHRYYFVILLPNPFFQRLQQQKNPFIVINNAIHTFACH